MRKRITSVAAKDSFYNSAIAATLLTNFSSKEAGDRAFARDSGLVASKTDIECPH
jgi:hypothetical protein